VGSLFNLPPKSIRHRRLPRANCLISMGIMGGDYWSQREGSNFRPADYERDVAPADAAPSALT